MPGIGRDIFCDNCEYSAKVLDGVNDQMVSLKPAICRTCRAAITAIDDSPGPDRKHRCRTCGHTELEFIPVPHDGSDRIGPAPCPRCDGTLDSEHGEFGQIIDWD